MVSLHFLVAYQILWWTTPLQSLALNGLALGTFETRCDVLCSKYHLHDNVGLFRPLVLSQKTGHYTRTICQTTFFAYLLSRRCPRHRFTTWQGCLGCGGWMWKAAIMWCLRWNGVPTFPTQGKWLRRWRIPPIIHGRRMWKRPSKPFGSWMTAYITWLGMLTMLRRWLYLGLGRMTNRRSKLCGLPTRHGKTPEI